MLTVSTFHCGSPRSLIVLADWRDFLGEVNATYRVATKSELADNFNEADLTRISPEAELIRHAAPTLSVGALDPLAVFDLIERAETPYLLLVKLDTLPYRAGHENWLPQAIDRMERHGCWGLTGSFRATDLEPIGEGFALTQKFSQNFALFRPAAWLEAARAVDPAFLERLRAHRTVRRDRLWMEGMIEQYLRRQNERMLFIGEAPDFTIFHVNQWGEDLLRVRERYRARRAISHYLNVARPLTREPWQSPPWRRYYGYPAPPMTRRLRTWLGQQRRRLTGLGSNADAGPRSANESPQKAQGDL